MTFTANYSERIDFLRQAIREADHIIIGAGSGLSTAAGIDYGGEEFRCEFAPWIERYGFTDLYTSSFYAGGILGILGQAYLVQPLPHWGYRVVQNAATAFPRGFCGDDQRRRAVRVGWFRNRENLRHSRRLPLVPAGVRNPENID